MMNQTNQLLQEYIVSLDNKNRSNNTINSYMLDIKLLFDYLDSIQVIDKSNITSQTFNNITLSNLNSFLNFCKNTKNNSSKTIARKIASIQSLYSFLRKNKYITEDISLDLESPKIEQRSLKCLSVNQSMELLDGIEGEFKIRDTAIITVFLNCALRLSELTSLNVEQIKGNCLFVIGKGNKERKIFLNEECLEKLREYIATRNSDVIVDDLGNPLFVDKFNKRISNKAVQNLVKKHLDYVGLDVNEFHVHSLRHTSATAMYKSNTPLLVISQLLGHSSVATSQIYTHIDDEQMQQASNANPFNLKGKKEK